MIYLYIAIGVVVAYLLITLIIFFYIFGKPKPVDFSQGKNFIYKDEIAKGKLGFLKRTKEEVNITSFDKTKLTGYLFEIDNPTGVIILSHGYKSNGFQDYGVVFDLYQSYGLNILIIDQRAHGKSKGRFCTYGIKESKDMAKWVEYLNLRYPNLPVRISGISLGSSVALYSSSLKLNNVVGIIADCGFTSPIDEIKEVCKQMHAPYPLFLPMVGLYAKIFLKINYKQSAVDSVKKTSIPILFIHGKADKLVPFKMGELLFKECNSPKMSCFIDNAGHGESYLKDKETVSKCLQKHFNGDFK